MGKSKRALETPVAATVVPEDAPVQVPSVGVRPELPQHSRQAAFSLFYLFVFSCMMFTLPFCAYYGTRLALNEYFDVSYFQTTVYSVLATVCTVNVIIVGYAVVAYHETEYDDEGNVIDQSRPIPPPPSAAPAVTAKPPVAAGAKPKKNKAKLI